MVKKAILWLTFVALLLTGLGLPFRGHIEGEILLWRLRREIGLSGGGIPGLARVLGDPLFRHASTRYLRSIAHDEREECDRRHMAIMILDAWHALAPLDEFVELLQDRDQTVAVHSAHVLHRVIDDYGLGREEVRTLLAPCLGNSNPEVLVCLISILKQNGLALESAKALRALRSAIAGCNAEEWEEQRASIQGWTGGWFEDFMADMATGDAASTERGVRNER